ncbi:type IV secretory system conjugative DNA transfer family protein [Bdellovibrio bacteriovorus]|uniref:type IV secretory system conjugative DNA transfer family protein n=1 Tax=Bdellovibrio bacteriovorus TaxID=959 RepID=UPI0035A589C5
MNLKDRFRKLLGLSSSGESLSIGRIKGSLFKREWLSDAEVNHHVHIVGASGFGKTVLLTKILRDRIKRGQGCLWIDLKGDRESINEMIDVVEKQGRKEDLRIFSLSNPEISGNYNLLGNGTATELRDKIVSSLVWSEEFYKSQAMVYLLKLLVVLCWRRDSLKVPIDLFEVLKGISSEEFMQDLCLSVPSGEVKVKTVAEDCYHYLAKKEAYQYLTGLRAQLESFTLSDFGEYLRHSEMCIDLFQAVNSQKIVFIFLDSRRYGESARSIAKMIVKDLISTSARIDAEVPKLKRKHFVCFIDEFADIAQEDFTAFPDRARSSKMSLVLSHQELSDLKRVSETFYARMTANMATLYAFLQSNPDSAEEISKKAGTKAVWKETIRAEKFWFLSLRTGDRSLEEVEEFRIHPNTVKSLRVGECVVVKKYPHARSHVVRVDEK